MICSRFSVQTSTHPLRARPRHPLPRRSPQIASTMATSARPPIKVQLQDDDSWRRTKEGMVVASVAPSTTPTKQDEPTSTDATQPKMDIDQQLSDKLQSLKADIQRNQATSQTSEQEVLPHPPPPRRPSSPSSTSSSSRGSSNASRRTSRRPRLETAPAKPPGDLSGSYPQRRRGRSPVGAPTSAAGGASRTCRRCPTARLVTRHHLALRMSFASARSWTIRASTRRTPWASPPATSWRHLVYASRRIWGRNRSSTPS